MAIWLTEETRQTIYHISWLCNWWTNLQSLACSSHDINRHWNLINFWLWIDWTEPSQAKPSQTVLSILVRASFFFFTSSFWWCTIWTLLKTCYTITIIVNTVNTTHTTTFAHHRQHRHPFVIFLWNVVLVLWQRLMWIFFFYSIRIWSDFICLLMFRIKYVACERDEMRARQYCTWKSFDMSGYMSHGVCECCIYVPVPLCVQKVVYLCIYCHVLHVMLPILKHESHANIISKFFIIQKAGVREPEREQERKKGGGLSLNSVW